jgi:Kef-type K+ transport system membrane component KefB
MTNNEFGLIAAQLFLLIALAHLCGYLFTRLRQPRVVGEILAGLLLGPSVLGRLAPSLSTLVFPASSVDGGAHHDVVIAFLYNLGLLLLMFASGAETKRLFTRHDRREVAWLGTVGTGLPFLLVLLASPWLPLHDLMGAAGQRAPVVLVVGIAAAVTSIPVISKIMHDLGILHTRFARLVLGVAVLEDIVLWAVLAIATALAHASAVPQRQIALHVALTLVYFGAGLTAGPALLRRLNAARWNVLTQTSPVAYVVLVLLAYTGLAAAMGVSLVFAAFLAGYGIIADRERFPEALDAIRKFSFAVFIPLYFAVVGYRLDLGKTFSLTMLAVFLVSACVLKLLAAGAGARLARFNWKDTFNLAVALNARGGPGIVLASVAFDAGIINAAFYTTLVLVAILTSQAAGWWLESVMRRGEPLLAGQTVEAFPGPTPTEEAQDTLAA